MVAAFRAMRRCKEGGNFNSHARREIDAAYRLCAGALRIEVEPIEAFARIRA